MWYALLACTPSPVETALPDDSDAPADTDVIADTDTDVVVDTDTDVVVDTDTDVVVDTDTAVDTDPPAPLVPDFALADVNPTSLRYQQTVSPRDYIGKVAGFYFTHAT